MAKQLNQMQKKRRANGPATQVLGQTDVTKSDNEHVAARLRADVERCQSNDGTWELIDDGASTARKIAIAMVLWPAREDVRDLTNDHAAAEKALGHELWAAVQLVKAERRNLEGEIETAAECFEADPKSIDLDAIIWADIAALQLLGYETRWSIPDNATDHIKAMETVRRRWTAFATYNNYELSTSQQRRIWKVFRRVGAEDVVPLLAPEVRERDAKALRRLAKQFSTFERILERAPAAALDAAFRGAGTNGASIRLQLRAASRACDLEAVECDKSAKVRRDFQGGKAGRGRRKDLASWHLLEVLADVFEDLTGSKAKANYRASEDNRKRDFVKFAQEMCKRAGRSDLIGRMEGTAQRALEKRSEDLRQRHAKAP